MSQQSEKQQKMEQLAREVLLLSRNTLLVNLRFLDAALSQLALIPGPWPLAVDGEHIYYDASAVLRVYRQEKERSVRDYLHMVLHCVFRHSFVDTLVDHDCWDLACDMAVEAVITELDIRAATASCQSRQVAVLEELREQVKDLTAEKLYRHLLDHRPDPEKFLELRELFYADDHTLWYLPPEQKAALTGQAAAVAQNTASVDGGFSGGDSSTGQAAAVAQNTASVDGGSSGRDSSDGDGAQGESSLLRSARAGLIQRWKDISERMQTDLETFSRQRGDTAGGLVQNLRAVNREQYDYASFLRKFAVLGEAMKVNDDEFDYIFYTYGLKLFGNMPLIEPLEYKEVKRIREFVIAIDTSGSVSGELVQKFVQKTYNILKQEESFFKKINLHILQCDAEIQEDVKITNQEEFDRYLQTMQLRGFGGTDFRPVFSHVEELRRNKEFVNLKGLIYFTDGYGVFPEKKPDYPTAFVFVNERYELPEVPTWAIKLVLEPEEI